MNGTNFVLGDQGQISVSGAVVTLTSAVGSATDADLIDIDAGTNAVIAGSGADAITVNGGTNTIAGDDASGTFSTSGALAQITSSALSNSAADTIILRSGTNYAIAGDGADDINLVNGTNFVLGDQGTISVSGAVVTLTSAVGSASDTDLIDIDAGTNAVRRLGCRCHYGEWWYEHDCR